MSVLARCSTQLVSRRIGGLEIAQNCDNPSVRVSRRIGGLEMF